MAVERTAPGNGAEPGLTGGAMTGGGLAAFGEGLPTIGSYFAAFSPAPAWEELCAWPPDVFALANLVLDHTEAYRFVVSPSGGHRWPPDAEWEHRVRAAGAEWKHSVGRGLPVPGGVAELWAVVTRHRDLPLAAVRRAEAPGLVAALLTLHAMADEACSGLSVSRSSSGADSFEARAWRLLAVHGSMSRLSPARVRITPKTHLTMRGITIRSLSRYLALGYEAVDLEWRRIEASVWARAAPVGSRFFNIVLVPWPLRVASRAFRRVEGPLGMDTTAFGFFDFAPDERLNGAHLAALLAEAERKAGRIDAVVLPEGAVDDGDLGLLEELVEPHQVTFLIAGVRRPGRGAGLGGNYVHLGVLTADGWERYRQDKHHRWCLDGRQIRQYHLSRALDPRKEWWEGIELPPRTLQVIDIGGGGITVPLVCEDLARMDEVTDLVRRIGPSMVVALLLDGPQLTGRWPCRYAAVLADEPGSAVLTLTAFGMAARSRPAGKAVSRVVALWSDPSSGLHEVALGRGASAILITALVEDKVLWTADGRRHDHDAPALVLSEVRQLRARPPSGGAAGSRKAGRAGSRSAGRGGAE